MSSILKALKKLEAEKYARQPEEINLSREILEPRTGQAGIRKRLWAGMIALFSALVILSALLVGKRSFQQEPVLSRPPLSTPAPAEIQSPAVRSNESTSTPERAVKIPALQDNSYPVELRVNKEQTRQQPITPAPDTTVRPELPSSQSSPDSSHHEPDRKASTLRSADPAEPALTLSGIAWNKDSADRLAIINGHPAATGAVVNGAVIEEILPDRVRMNQSGRTFELFLGRQQITN